MQDERDKRMERQLWIFVSFELFVLVCFTNERIDSECNDIDPNAIFSIVRSARLSAESID